MRLSPGCVAAGQAAKSIRTQSLLRTSGYFFLPFFFAAFFAGAFFFAAAIVSHLFFVGRGVAEAPWLAGRNVRRTVASAPERCACAQHLLVRLPAKPGGLLRAGALHDGEAQVDDAVAAPQLRPAAAAASRPRVGPSRLRAPAPWSARARCRPRSAGRRSPSRPSFRGRRGRGARIRTARPRRPCRSSTGRRAEVRRPSPASAMEALGGRRSTKPRRQGPRAAVPVARRLAAALSPARRAADRPPSLPRKPSWR